MEKKSAYERYLEKAHSEHYDYYNNNPQKKLTEDCVVRAIAAGLHKDWETVYRELTEYSIKTGYIQSARQLFGKYLVDNGWVRQKRPNPINGKRMLLREFVQMYKGRAIVNAGIDHVTYIENGKIKDTWNPEDKFLGSYWIPGMEVSI